MDSEMMYVIKSAVFVDHRNRNLRELAEARLAFGRPISRKFPKTTLEIQEEELPDWFSSGQFYVISGRLRDVFEAAHVHGEFLPLTIIGENKDIFLGKYFLFNALDVLDVIDEKQSRIWRDPKNALIRRIERLSLKDVDKLPPLFALDSAEFILCAQSSLKDAVLNSGILGLQFIQLESYEFPL
jgi:hypothetical protein